MDDWLNDEDDAKTSNSTNILAGGGSLETSKLRAVGAQEGIREGMRCGEREGFIAGYNEEYFKAVELGKVVGCCRVFLGRDESSSSDVPSAVLAVKDEMTTRLQELETLAKTGADFVPKLNEMKAWLYDTCKVSL